MNIHSPAFEEGKPIPAKYTCMGENISPPLAFSDIPIDTKSLVLILEDPDAPVHSFFHWLMWNIDPKTIVILEDSVPREAIQGTNDFGDKEYGGPCPHLGTHRYIFKLYALDTTLSISPSSKIDEIEQAVSGHILGQSQTFGVFSK